MDTLQRYFIAYRLPPKSAQQLCQRIQPLKVTCKTRVNWVPPENYHITLKFLGNLNVLQAKNITSLLKTAFSSQASTSLITTSLCLFPSARHPHVLVICCNATDTIITITNRIEQLMSPAFTTSEKHAFTPHITLARLRSYEKIPRSFEQYPLSTIKLLIDHIALVKSLPGSKGVNYQTVFKQRLK